MTTTEQTMYELTSHNSEKIGFFHGGGKIYIKGWWLRADGSEGGELMVIAKKRELIDFDGIGALPTYIKEELNSLGIDVDHD